MIYGSTTLLLCCWRGGRFAALLRFGYIYIYIYGGAPFVFIHDVRHWVDLVKLFYPHPTRPGDSKDISGRTGGEIDFEVKKKLKAKL